MTSTGALTFTTTHRMVNRVHCNTTYMRSSTFPSVPTSLTELGATVLAVANGTNAGAAVFMELANLTGRKTYQNVVAFFGHELRGNTSGAHELGAFADFHFDVMDNGTQRDVVHRQAVTWLDINVVASHNHVTHSYAVRGENVTFLTIHVVEQCDVGRSVGIVFNRHYFSVDSCFVTLEIDDTIFTLVSTTDVAGCHASVVVSSAGLGQACHQTFFRTLAGQLRILYGYLVSLTG